MIRAVLLPVAAAVLLSAGCARQQEEAPAPADPRHGAPAVAAPRDISSFARTPCEGPLSADDVAALGLRSQGRQQALVTGEQACEWSEEEGIGAVGLTIVGSRDVLVDTYRVRQFEIFEPIVVGGLPAVQERSSSDAVICNVTVGTADGQGFIIDLTEGVGSDGRRQDPCQAGRQVAERIVQKLPVVAGK